MGKSDDEKKKKGWCVYIAGIPLVESAECKLDRKRANQRHQETQKTIKSEQAVEVAQATGTTGAAAALGAVGGIVQGAASLAGTVVGGPLAAIAGPVAGLLGSAGVPPEQAAAVATPVAGVAVAGVVGAGVALGVSLLVGSPDEKPRRRAA